MTDFCHIMFERNAGKVKSFSTASGAKATRLTIVLEFTDSYALSRVTQELHDMQHPPKPSPPPAAPSSAAKTKRAALTAPVLGLPFYGDEQ